MKNHTKDILPEMFDVRPMKRSGAVDWERVQRVRQAAGQPVSERSFAKEQVSPAPVSDTENFSVDGNNNYAFLGREEKPHSPRAVDSGSDNYFSDMPEQPAAAIFMRKVSCMAWPIKWLGIGLLFVTIGVAGREALSLRGQVLGESEAGYRSLSEAAASLEQGDVSQSDQDFETAYRSFSSAWEHLGIWQLGVVDALQYVPFLSQVVSGKNIIDAGRHIARAGYLLNDIFSSLSLSGNPLSQKEFSFLDLLDKGGQPLEQALPELEAARDALAQVSLVDIPPEKVAAFEKAQKTLPIVIGAARSLLEKRALLEEMLGGNGPRKYLFLFQNNHEIRPTGGFIGSYGVLDMKDGKIRKFFVDGIFNPDGQLKEKIIPPTPLQKVSAAWSLHDSNWSPDFRAAALKAMYFYEKTGGPTVDGVIALTPDIVRDLVGIFGPIEMKEYGVTLTRDNFVPAVQEEVEVNYDREANQPKKILSDLAPILLEKIFSTKDPKKLFSVLEVLTNHLNRRNILLYAREKEAEAGIDALGWSGRMEETPIDYLAVINANINGFKTDAVVKESISHEAAIRNDGSVVDTVRITRRHEGGQSSYEWWNKVNADYMRVYVPRGSELLSVKGQTREIVRPPLDYTALGFAVDPDIAKEEQALTIDEQSGTRIGDELGKTSFGNWMYVSPGESTTIEYRYRLPFRIAEADYASYSILFQKQPGSLGSMVKSTIDFPGTYRLQWQTGEFNRKNTVLAFESTLEKNIFAGAVWQIVGEAPSDESFQNQ